MADELVFRAGFIPTADQMPPERTYQRARLIYNLVRVIVFMSEPKRRVAFKEIKDVNSGLHELVKTYYARLTPAQLKFFIGPRPQYNPDGTLAIYHPQLDNPVLQTVLAGERPLDVDRWGAPMSKLVLPRSLGGIL